MSTNLEEYPFICKGTEHAGMLYALKRKDDDRRPTKPIDIMLYDGLFLQPSEDTCSSLDVTEDKSKGHIRLYTILFNDADDAPFPPLAYAEPLSTDGAYWNGIKIAKENGAVLLSDGDKIGCSPTAGLVFRCRKSSRARMPQKQRKETEIFDEEYEIKDRPIGVGGFSNVFLAWDKSKSQQVACKVMDGGERKRELEDLDKQEIDNNPTAQLSRQKRRESLVESVELDTKYFEREIEILRKLSHPNIVTIEAVFRTDSTFYVFQELATGCDLWSYQNFRGRRFPEVEAAGMVQQILLGLEYLHDKSIVHRDIKPDNILLTSLAPSARLVITDFGCARVVTREEPQMRTLVGTVPYNAPEMLDGRVTGAQREGFYTKSVDLWAVGCLTAELVTGLSPFASPGTGVFSSRRARKVNLYSFGLDPRWMRLGNSTRRFISRLLVRDGEERMTATEALAHEWVKKPANDAESKPVYEQAVGKWTPRSDVEVHDFRTSILEPPFEPSSPSNTPVTAVGDRTLSIELLVPSLSQQESDLRQLEDPNWFEHPRTAPPRPSGRPHRHHNASHHSSGFSNSLHGSVNNKSISRDKDDGFQGKLKSGLRICSSWFRKWKDGSSLSFKSPGGGFTNIVSRFVNRAINGGTQDRNGGGQEGIPEDGKSNDRSSQGPT